MGANICDHHRGAERIHAAHQRPHDDIPGTARLCGAFRERGKATLTNYDTHDNWPPEAFKPFLTMAAAGGLRGTLDAMLSDKSVYRSPASLGTSV
jgi:hypothetical protein